MIFKIPVSGLSPKKAKNTLSQLMNSYRNNNRKIQVLLEDSLYKDNLEEFEKDTSLEKREDTLFHLLTHKSSFHVAGVKIHDYNSAINHFLEKKYYL